MRPGQQVVERLGPLARASVGWNADGRILDKQLRPRRDPEMRITKPPP